MLPSSESPRVSCVTEAFISAIGSVKVSPSSGIAPSPSETPETVETVKPASTGIY
jgi:hypothetical protein